MNIRWNDGRVTGLKGFGDLVQEHLWKELEHDAREREGEVNDT